MIEPGLHIVHGANEGTAGEAEPEIDIVAVHGLNFKNNPNHARATWSRPGVLWLKDFLPASLQKPCRVMLFAYNSSPAMGAAAMLIDDHAKMLLNCLAAMREEAPKRPLLFICHSLGGIVVKSALVEATLNPAYHSILHSARLLVFFATPHQGGNYSGIGDVAAKIVRLGIRTPGNDLLDGLKAGSHGVMRRFEQARHLPETCLVVSFYETEDYGRLGIIVDKESAILGLPEGREKRVAMNANHSSICKFATASSCEPVASLIAVELERALELHRALEPGPENIHWLVPRSASPFLIGRAKITSNVIGSISPILDETPACQKRFILTGIGGQGKSEICLNVVNQVRSLFWGIFWVDVGSKATATAGFSRIARMLGSDAKEIDDILLLLSNCEAKNNWLLVLDNADDRDIDYAQYFPSGTRGTVIMTSRLPECSLHSTIGHEEVDNLDQDSCVSLLMKASRVPEETWPSLRPAAEMISKELGFHTLALLHAAAYIASGYCSMPDYAAEYKRQRERLLKFGLTQSQSRYRNVYATFEASAHVLEVSNTESSRDALDFLEMLSTFHHEDIPVQFFDQILEGAKRAWKTPSEDETLDQLSKWHIAKLPLFLRDVNSPRNQPRLSSALDQLCSLALVKKSQTRGMTVLSLHPLIHSWIATRQEHTQRLSWLRSSACAFALWQYANHGWKLYIDRLGPHLTFMLGATSFVDEVKASVHMVQTYIHLGELMQNLRYDHQLSVLLDQMFHYFNADMLQPTKDLLPIYNMASFNQNNLGNFKTSIHIIKKVLQIQESSTEIKMDFVLTSQTALGRAYLVNGETKQALATLEKINKIQDLHLPRDDPSRVALKNILGMAYRANSQPKEAIQVLQEGLRIELLHEAEGNPSLSALRYEIARSYLDNGQIKDAILIFQQALAIQEKYVHARHPNLLAMRGGLARALLSNGQTKEAIEIFEKICELKEEDTKFDHPAILATRYLLAAAYHQDGRVKQSISILEDILQLYDCDEDHPNRLAIRYELGSAYLTDGHTKKALHFLQETKAIQNSRFDEGHIHCIQLDMILSTAYMKDGQTAAAISVLERLLELQEKFFDEGHGNRCAVLRQLGIVYLGNGEVHKATNLLEEVVKIEDIALEPGNPTRESSKEVLGSCYLASGQTKKAVELLEDIVELSRKTLGEGHPNGLHAQHELARAYFADSQLDRSVTLFEHVVSMQSKLLDADHPDQVTTKRLLGLTYLALGKPSDAMAIFEEAYNILQTKLEEYHPLRVQSQNDLAKGYLASNHVELAIELLEEVVRIRNLTLTANHPDQLESKVQLSSAYLASNLTKDAISVLEEVVSAHATQGDQHRLSRLSAQHSLGVAYFKDGRIKAAISVLEEVVGAQSNLDECHRNKLAAQYELGRCYRLADRIPDAIAIFDDLVRVESATLERDDPSRLLSQHELGCAYLANGQAKEAIKILEEVVMMRRQTLSRGDPLCIASEHELGVAYLEGEHTKKGISILNDVLAIQKEYLAEDHFLRHNTQYELGSIYLNLGQTKKAIPMLEDLSRILKQHLNEQHPKSIDVQQQLVKARKLNNPVSRTMLRLGLR